jgi:hypothetical protein
MDLLHSLRTLRQIFAISAVKNHHWRGSVIRDIEFMAPIANWRHLSIITISV